MPDKPLLLLDIDGVLNAVGRPVGADYRFGTTLDLDICWRPALVEQLCAIHAEAEVELAWLTSWTDRADQHLAPLLGLPRGLRVLPRDRIADEAHPVDWKLRSARRELDGSPRRFVWADDELGGCAAAWMWLASLPDRRGLGLAVDPGPGLTDEQLAKARGFLRAG